MQVLLATAILPRESIMSGNGLVTLVAKVQCVGGQLLEFPITSSTTCGEVIAQIKGKLKLENCANGFGLFEGCGQVHKCLMDKHFVSDVLSKWEVHEAPGINPDGGNWQLIFKLFAFRDPLSPQLSVVEQKFIYEQAFESVMNRKFPADDETLEKLLALRMQYVVGDHEEGDHEEGACISDVVKVHPEQRPRELTKTGPTKTGLLSRLKRTSRRKKGPTDEDVVKIKQRIVMQWQQLNGMSVDDARIAHMEIIHSWNGCGANLFDVECVQTKNGWPKELWLAVSLDGIGIFPRNERESLVYHSYESVLSFGAPAANKYKIVVDNAGPMLFEANMVLEIGTLMKEYIKAFGTRNQ